MRSITLIGLLLFSITSYAQDIDEVKDVIREVIKFEIKFEKDIYYKFHNTNMINFLSVGNFGLTERCKKDTFSLKGKNYNCSSNINKLKEKDLALIKEYSNFKFKKKKRRKKSIYYLSYPVFSLDKNTCLIYQKTNESNRMILIFKKNKSKKWELDTHILRSY